MALRKRKLLPKLTYLSNGSREFIKTRNNFKVRAFRGISTSRINNESKLERSERKDTQPKSYGKCKPMFSVECAVHARRLCYLFYDSKN